MAGGVNATRLRHGAYLLVLGLGFTAVGLSVGTEFATSTQLMLLGPLVFLAGVGFVGASFVPVVVERVGGENATWDDLSLAWQMSISFVIAIGLFVAYLIIWSLLP